MLVDRKMILCPFLKDIVKAEWFCPTFMQLRSYAPNYAQIKQTQQQFSFEFLTRPAFGITRINTECKPNLSKELNEQEEAITNSNLILLSSYKRFYKENWIDYSSFKPKSVFLTQKVASTFDQNFFKEFKTYLLSFFHPAILNFIGRTIHTDDNIEEVYCEDVSTLNVAYTIGQYVFARVILWWIMNKNVIPHLDSIVK
jgi:hypothetical protein